MSKFFDVSSSTEIDPTRTKEKILGDIQVEYDWDDDWQEDYDDECDFSKIKKLIKKEIKKGIRKRDKKITNRFSNFDTRLTSVEKTTSECQVGLNLLTDLTGRILISSRKQNSNPLRFDNKITLGEGEYEEK